jgi:hypothetical protein
MHVILMDGDIWREQTVLDVLRRPCASARAPARGASSLRCRFR